MVLILHARWRTAIVGLLSLGISLLSTATAQDQAADPQNHDSPPAVAAPQSVQALADKVRPALAVFQVADRDGQSRGVGTGFAVSADGLIATNLHVIGEGRTFQVELADGRKPKVLEVHAADRHLDLAIVRVATDDQPLIPLSLGTADQLPVGAPLVVMGNPLGLRYSVVAGVLSARREMDGRAMLQLAIPIEPGNSGGPVLDLQGRVHGVVTMKSTLSHNLGFAVETSQLRALLEKPNPVAIARWVSIGGLDQRRWQALFGAHWRQRGGRITVEGTGEGFGGRSLCLSRAAAPDRPFEVGVEVKLDDEAGAAGLVFHCDGHEKHYGFYPSHGRLRLTCFQGPSVFNWQVLREEGSEHYKPGDWNHLRVRIEADRFLCYLNGHVVFVSQDATLGAGQVGLAKFRETKAEFRHFHVGLDAAQQVASVEAVEAAAKLIGGLPPLSEQTAETLKPLSELGPVSARVLRDRAKQLEQQAAEFRKAAEDLQLQLVVNEIERLTRDDPAYLLRGALLIARLDDTELDVEAYENEIDRMAQEIRERVPQDADATARMAALDQYLFRENGFHGSRHEYYHRANSHLGRVIDDREGLPITLSLLYIEVARRLDLKVEGVGLPGHFVVRHSPPDGSAEMIDVFEAGRRLSQDDVGRMFRAATQTDPTDEDLRASTAGEILQRMLRNLMNVAERDADMDATRRYLEALVALDPASHQYRGMRALARFQTGRRSSAIDDLDWFLDRQPEGVDLDRIREMRNYFENAGPTQ
jgi:serine protease Do